MELERVYQNELFIRLVDNLPSDYLSNQDRIFEIMRKAKVSKIHDVPYYLAYIEQKKVEYGLSKPQSLSVPMMDDPIYDDEIKFVSSKDSPPKRAPKQPRGYTSVDTSVAENIRKMIGEYPPMLKDHKEHFRELDEFKRRKDISNIQEKTKYIYNHNLRLITSVIKKLNASVLPFEDMFHEGTIGLLNAIGTFDVERGIKFSTYAIQCIKNEILKKIDRQFPVHISSQDSRRIFRFKKIRDELMSRAGESPSHEEIACAYEERYGKFVTSETVRTALEFAPSFVSTDAPIQEDEDIIFADVIIDKNSPDPVDITEKGDLVEGVKKMLATLKESDEEIVTLAYGLNNNRKHTLQEIANMKGVSKERIRQRLKDIIESLTHPARIKHVIHYWSDGYDDLF